MRTPSLVDHHRCSHGLGFISPDGGDCSAMGVESVDLKLITAVFVFAALILPELLGKIGESRVRAANA